MEFGRKRKIGRGRLADFVTYRSLLLTLVTLNYVFDNG
jgi:hypothetical protein